MSLMSKICELLGVEIDEEFKIKQTSGNIKSAKYRFRNIGDQIIYEHTDFCGDWTMCSAEEVGLLVLGKHEIVKLPFEPKAGEVYWYVYWANDYIRVTCTPFADDDMHYHHKYCGNFFRTEKEAEAHKYEIYEKLTVRKWEEK